MPPRPRRPGTGFAAVLLGLVLMLLAPTAGSAAGSAASAGGMPSATGAAEDPAPLRFNSGVPNDPSSDYPHVVQRTFAGKPVGHDRLIRESLSSSDPSPVHIQLRSDDGALSFPSPAFDVDLAPSADGRYHAEVKIRAESDAPGLHGLTVTASQSTASGEMDASIDLTHVWAAGNARIPGSDSLAGHQYRVAYQVGNLSCRTCAAQHTREYTFVDATHAVLGAPLSLRHACAPNTCVPYEYDAAAGLLQVGERTFGSAETGFAGHALLLSALPARPGTPATFQKLALYEYQVLRPGERLDETWATQDVKGTAEQLRLGRAGRYTYSLRTHQRGRVLRLHLAGRYQVVRGGTLQLRDRTGRHVLLRALLSVRYLTSDGRYRYGALLVDHTFDDAGHRIHVARNEAIVQQ